MPRRLHSIVALCLALIWVPATVCCRLQAAAIEPAAQSDGCKECDPAKPADPGAACKTVEGGHYHSAVSILKLSPQSTLLCVLICAPALSLDVDEIQQAAVLAKEELRRPRDWLPVWQFERRAAAPAHAPDSLTV
ncbi:hypothetical protein OPIT5_27295 [Opitutaceae bacterium TAV5]|nr:hypothetical protein OPIT5_27295 [Opitutaceae bacterium TAV5]